MMDRSSTSSSRQEWVDVARGVGIILVVYGHILRGNFNPKTRPAWASVQDAMIYSFHMPLFFVLAGLFLWPSIGRGRTNYLKDRWWTIAYPYLLWSLVCGLIEVVMSRFVNSPLGWVDIASIPIKPIEQFWFLYALFITQVVAALSFPSKLRLWVIAVAGVALVTVFGRLSIVHRAFYFLPYVALGVSAAGLMSRLAIAPPMLRVIVAVFAWLSFLVLWAMGEDCLARNFALASAGSLGVLAMAMLVPKGTAGNVLAELGRASLAIFALHTLFSAGTRIALQRVGVDRESVVSIVLSTVVGLSPWLLWQWSRGTRFEYLIGFGSKPAKTKPA